MSVDIPSESACYFTWSYVELGATLSQFVGVLHSSYINGSESQRIWWCQANSNSSDIHTIHGNP